MHIFHTTLHLSTAPVILPCLLLNLCTAAAAVNVLYAHVAIPPSQTLPACALVWDSQQVWYCHQPHQALAAVESHLAEHVHPEHSGNCVLRMPAMLPSWSAGLNEDHTQESPVQGMSKDSCKLSMKVISAALAAYLPQL